MLMSKLFSANEDSINTGPGSTTSDGPVRFTDPFTGRAIPTPNPSHEGPARTTSVLQPTSKRIAFDTPIETQQESANSRLIGTFAPVSYPSFLYDLEN